MRLFCCFRPSPVVLNEDSVDEAASVAPPMLESCAPSEVLTNTGPVSVLGTVDPWRAACPQDQPLLLDLSADCLTPLTWLGEGAYGSVELCRISIPVATTPVAAASPRTPCPQAQEAAAPPRPSPLGPIQRAATEPRRGSVGVGGTAHSGWHPRGGSPLGSLREGDACAPAEEEEGAAVVVRPGGFSVARLRLRLSPRDGSLGAASPPPLDSGRSSGGRHTQRRARPPTPPGASDAKAAAAAAAAAGAGRGGGASSPALSPTPLRAPHSFTACAASPPAATVALAPLPAARRSPAAPAASASAPSSALWHEPPLPSPAPAPAASASASPRPPTSPCISNELVVAVKRVEYRGAGRAAGVGGAGAGGGGGGAPAPRGPSRARLCRMQAIELLQLSRCRDCPFIVRVFGCVPEPPPPQPPQPSAPGGAGAAAGGGGSGGALAAAAGREAAASPPAASAASTASSACRIVMEWAEGGDLGSLLGELQARRGPPGGSPCRERLLMGEASARYYLACLLEALAFLHGRGLLHRDVKPANLLLASGGVAKLGDLGMVCHLDRRGRAEGHAGTPNYMAPEVWCFGTAPKYDSYGATADLWSAGVVLHELLTGHLPARHPDEYLHPSWRLTALAHPGLSPQLRDLLSRLLALKPRRRPQSCAEVAAHPWFAGFDWSALRAGTLPPPYVPAAHRPAPSAPPPPPRPHDEGAWGRGLGAGAAGASAQGHARASGGLLPVLEERASGGGAPAGSAGSGGRLRQSWAQSLGRGVSRLLAPAQQAAVAGAAAPVGADGAQQGGGGPGATLALSQSAGSGGNGLSTFTAALLSALLPPPPPPPPSGCRALGEWQQQPRSRSCLLPQRGGLSASEAAAAAPRPAASPAAAAARSARSSAGGGSRPPVAALAPGAGAGAPAAAHAQAPCLGGVSNGGLWLHRGSGAAPSRSQGSGQLAALSACSAGSSWGVARAEEQCRQAPPGEPEPPHLRRQSADVLGAALLAALAALPGLPQLGPAGRRAGGWLQQRLAEAAAAALAAPLQLQAALAGLAVPRAGARPQAIPPLPAWPGAGCPGGALAVKGAGGGGVRPWVGSVEQRSWSGSAPGPRPALPLPPPPPPAAAPPCVFDLLSGSGSREPATAVVLVSRASGGPEAARSAVSKAPAGGALAATAGGAPVGPGSREGAERQHTPPPAAAGLRQLHRAADSYCLDEAAGGGGFSGSGSRRAAAAAAAAQAGASSTPPAPLHPGGTHCRLKSLSFSFDVDALAARAGGGSPGLLAGSSGESAGGAAPAAAAAAVGSAAPCMAPIAEAEPGPAAASGPAQPPARVQAAGQGALGPGSWAEGGEGALGVRTHEVQRLLVLLLAALWALACSAAWRG